MTRDEKTFFERLLLLSGISSFFCVATYVMRCDENM